MVDDAAVREENEETKKVVWPTAAIVCVAEVPYGFRCSPFCAGSGRRCAFAKRLLDKGKVTIKFCVSRERFAKNKIRKVLAISTELSVFGKVSTCSHSYGRKEKENGAFDESRNKASTG